MQRIMPAKDLRYQNVLTKRELDALRALADEVTNAYIAKRCWSAKRQSKRISVACCASLARANAHRRRSTRCAAGWSISTRASRFAFLGYTPATRRTAACSKRGGSTWQR